MVFRSHFDPRLATLPARTNPQVPAQVPSIQPVPTPGWPGQGAFDLPGADIFAFRELYRQMALIYAGVTLPEEYVLVPFRYNKQTQIVQRADGSIVSLDAATPSQTLPFLFPVNAFCQRLTYQVTGLRLTEWGESEAGFFGNLDPGAYIQTTLGYSQQSEQLLSGPTPLAEVAGQNASLGGAYLFSTLPWIPKGTQLNLGVSILEPNFSGQAPPFVRSVGRISVTFDTLRVPILGG